MRLKKYLKERRTKAERILVYHGTSSKFLRKILKKGLIVDPKAKVWQDDPNASAIQASRQSLEGIYLANDFGTAYGASTNATRKFGGNPLIISILFQPRASLPDEDDIRYTLERIVIQALGISGFSETYYPRNLAFLIKDAPEARKIKTRYLEGILSYMDRLNISHRAFYKKTAINFLIAELIRATSHHYHRNKDAKYYVRRGWISAYDTILGKTLTGSDEDQKIVDKAYKELDDTLPKPSDAEKRYLKALDNMTRMLKGARMEYKTDRFTNFRSMEDITYRGRNRILSIAELIRIETDENYRRIIKVHYGKLSNEFLKVFKSRITKDFEVIKA